MKTPKLKYYYHALSIEEYAQFETTRRIEVTGSIVYDIVTNQMTGRTWCMLTGAAVSCDQEYRERTKSWAPVLVLRIPSELVDRGLLRPVPGQILVYQYAGSLLIPHCGVERIEIDTTQGLTPADSVYNIILGDQPQVIG
jgi:hypothetical protein